MNRAGPVPQAVHGASRTGPGRLMAALAGLLVAACATAPEPGHGPETPAVVTPGLASTPGAPFDPPPGPEPAPLGGLLGIDRLEPVQPDVVARVNGRPITKTELAEYLCLALPDTARVVLDSLVNLRIVREERARLGITLSEDQVAARLQVMNQVLAENARDRTMDVQAYVQAEKGVSYDVFQTMLPINARYQLVLERVVRFSQVLDDCVIGRIIVVEDRSEADRLVEQLRAGADFATVARRLSIHVTGSTGGELPPVGRWGVQPVLEDALFKMEPGSISDPIAIQERGKNLWCILKCVSHHPARQVAYSEVRDEVEKGLKDRPFREMELSGWLETMARRYQVEILLRAPESAWIRGRTEDRSGTGRK